MLFRSIGVSNFGVDDLSDLLSVGRCQANQLPYSLLGRAIEYEINPRCIENDIGILCYSPLAQGMLTGKFASIDDVPETRARTRHFSKDRSLTRHDEDGCETETFAAVESIRRICTEIDAPMAEVSLAWLLHRPGVTSVLAGARNPNQIKQNVRAANLKLEPEIVNKLTQATDDLKQKLGSNPDLWESVTRYR